MFDKILLLCFSLLGIGLFIFSLRKQPIKEWLLSFFLASFLANIVGTAAVDLKLLEYLEITSSLDTGSFYELILFPVVMIYFYQSSYRSNISGITFQCFLYTLVLTIVEIPIKKYTNLINYIHWNALITFITVFCFMIGVRLLLKLINQSEYSSLINKQ